MIELHFNKFVEPPLGRLLLQGEEVTNPGETLFFTISAQHQVYFRTTGGESNSYQECLIYTENAPARNGTELEALWRSQLPIRFGGFELPRETPWFGFEQRTGTWTYYFRCFYYRGQDWLTSSGIRRTPQGYEYGAKYLVGIEDDGGDNDYNDYLLEIAIVEAFPD